MADVKPAEVSCAAAVARIANQQVPLAEQRVAEAEADAVVAEQQYDAQFSASDRGLAYLPLTGQSPANLTYAALVAPAKARYANARDRLKEARVLAKIADGRAALAARHPVLCAPSPDRDGKVAKLLTSAQSVAASASHGYDVYAWPGEEDVIAAAEQIQETGKNWVGNIVLDWMVAR